MTHDLFRSFHFWTFLTNILPLTLYLFVNSVDWVQHENRANNSRKWLFTACVRYKKKWVVVGTWWWIYNELFTFWTNEKQINDRNFYLTLFFSLFFFISVFIFQFHLFIQWTAYTHIHYVFALLANTYEELSTLILCDNERI